MPITNVTKIVQKPEARRGADAEQQRADERAPHCVALGAAKEQRGDRAEQAAEREAQRGTSRRRAARGSRCVEGAKAKIAPAATSGARSSAAAISTSRFETGPFTFQRDGDPLHDEARGLRGDGARTGREEQAAGRVDAGDRA